MLTFCCISEFYCAFGTYINERIIKCLLPCENRLWDAHLILRGAWHFLEINILTFKMLKIKNLSTAGKKINSPTSASLELKEKCKFSKRMFSSLRSQKFNSQIIFPGSLGWSVVLGIYVALAVFQPYRDLEAGDNKSLKFKWRGRESSPGPLAPQAKSLTTRPPPLPSRLASLALNKLHIMYVHQRTLTEG